VGEGDDAAFTALVCGPEPLDFTWYVQPTWTNQPYAVAGGANPELVFTDVDAYDDGTIVRVRVVNAAGQELWLGPATLTVTNMPITIPAAGPASRYPAILEVQGQPANPASVWVTLAGLTHPRPDDLDILLVSPLGKRVMLMSDAGGNYALSQATVGFVPGFWGASEPPDDDQIYSSNYAPVDYQVDSGEVPGAPSGTNTTLDALAGDNPNGRWLLFIYDDLTGEAGELLRWRLDFD